MKRTFLLMAALLVSFLACDKEDFEENYADPSKIASSSVEKQFAGFIIANREYVVPSYWNYFVVLRPTVNRYTQVVGWVNTTAQYVPGAGLIGNRWDNYYNFLAQYRELQKIYANLSDDEQNDKRIFMIAATIYLYDHTQKVIDLHGDIPFSDAGMLSTNSGDYKASYPGYDKAEDLYTTMLDDLKMFADELNTIALSAGSKKFPNQDIINNGDLEKWKSYCNSLRLRMLSRVFDASAFQSRATSEIQAILADPSKYPVVSDNSANIQIEIYDLSSDIKSEGFRAGLEDWQGNLAGKAMIDHMVANDDPRLRVMFEPGENAGGEYKGLDPLMLPAEQQALADGGTISLYNRSTLSRNQYFPGVLINAAEVQLLIAEYYLKAGNDGAAKAAYNKAIEQSIEQYYSFRSISNDNTVAAPAPADANEIAAYQAEPAVAWDNAADEAAKLSLIATQKWLHYSVVQPIEGWAEQRRLDLPSFNFQVDNTNVQKLPPFRWFYANSERIYNTANYSAVKSADNLTTKIFWDTK